MKRWAIMGMLIVLGGNLNAALFSKVGTVGAQFLKIGIDPKGIGMGEAYTALAKDPLAIYWNPGGLALIKQQEVSFSDVEWFGGIRNNFIGYILPGALMGTLGMSISAFTSSQEDVTTPEEPRGTGDNWSYTAITCGISYARMMTDKFAFGINFKYLQERIWDIASQGMATDMGVYFYPGYWGSLRFGFVIKNFGPDMCFAGGHLFDEWNEDGTPSGISPTEIAKRATPYRLPLCLKLGTAYDIIDTPTNKLTLAVDVSSPNDGVEKLHIGIEECIMNMFSLRGGYTFDSDITEPDSVGTTKLEDREEGMGRFGCGIGITPGIQRLSVDYAVQDMRKLGLAHRIALNIKM